ncbi:MAG: long-chain-acyl-CoA synthetase [Candidatus Helarchaeota archaeon]|nr:long-chain-acyl-CoA synthetase [Candidatus Helarchaeota archaeon]
MPLFNTIPKKILPGLKRELKNEQYDNVILFVLAVYGPHKLKELVNDPSKSITDRMDEKVFRELAEEFKNRDLIEEYKRDNEIYYKITPEGEDELLKRLETIPALTRVVRRLINDFDFVLGASGAKKEIESESVSGYKLTYKDYIFGLLSIHWRLVSFLTGAGESSSQSPDDNISVGKYIENNAELYADRTALLYEDKKFSHKEQNEWINRYTNYFLALGMKKGDIINVMLENRPELIFIIGAMTKIGVIASLINTKQRAGSLIHILKLNPVQVYIIGEELFDAFEEVKSSLDLTDDVKLYFLEDKGEMQLPEGYINLKDEVQSQDVSNPPTMAEIKGRDTYCYIFTSGTTGLPKAAPIRNLHTITSLYAWGKMALNMQPEDVIYISLPFIHSMALHVAWAPALAGGSTVALARKFSVHNFWKDIRKHKATCFVYIGEICRYLLNQAPSPDDRSHKVIKICGNGLRPEIWMEFKERFGIREIYEQYGATEIKGQFCNYLNRNRTIGINPEPHAIVKYDIDSDELVRDEKGFLQKVDGTEAGLMLFKIGELTFAGYTDKKATEKKIIRNAFGNDELWLNTGDLLRYIGYYHAQFVDRLGDTFRWKSENVSTAEVEDVLSSFEPIDHSAVYGVKIPGTEGRAGMASIIPTKDHTEFDFQGLLKLLQNNLPGYAIPKFIRFLSELSTTVTHKVQKAEMKKAGYDLNKTRDLIYVLLPKSSGYTLLTEAIYDNIIKGRYRF